MSEITRRSALGALLGSGAGAAAMKHESTPMGKRRHGVSISAEKLAELLGLKESKIINAVWEPQHECLCLYVIGPDGRITGELEPVFFSERRLTYEDYHWQQKER